MHSPGVYYFGKHVEKGQGTHLNWVTVLQRKLLSRSKFGLWVRCIKLNNTQDHQWISEYLFDCLWHAGSELQIMFNDVKWYYLITHYDTCAPFELEKNRKLCWIQIDIDCSFVCVFLFVLASLFLGAISLHAYVKNPILCWYHMISALYILIATFNCFE